MPFPQLKIFRAANFTNRCQSELKPSLLLIICLRGNANLPWQRVASKRKMSRGTKMLMYDISVFGMRKASWHFTSVHTKEVVRRLRIFGLFCATAIRDVRHWITWPLKREKSCRFSPDLVGRSRETEFSAFIRGWKINHMCLRPDTVTSAFCASPFNASCVCDPVFRGIAKNDGAPSS